MSTTEVEPTLDESWETETGLLDEYTGTIVRSWFATDARYNDGNTIMLHWEIQTSDPEFPEVTEKFPCGGGWDSRDGGATIVHEQGKTKFNQNSIYGRIVKSVTDADGQLHDGITVIKQRGRPTSADIWTGLTFEFKRTEFNYGGEIGKKSRVMPVKFLGEGTQISLPTSNGNGNAAAAAPAPAPSAPAVEVDDVTAAKLRAAAKASDTHQAFLDAAMAIDGVVSNDDLMASVVDDTAAGFYATARA